MKKIVLLSISLMLLFSCQLYPKVIYDTDVSREMVDEIVEGMEVPDIFRWVATNIKYKADDKLFPTWQLPATTLLKGTGDCEDFSVLLVYMLERIGEQAYITLVDTTGDYSINHAIVYYNGKFIEPQSGTQITLQDVWMSQTTTLQFLTEEIRNWE